jgi:Ni/Fe-hydrogenase subunit HybB-like protein
MIYTPLLLLLLTPVVLARWQPARPVVNLVRRFELPLAILAVVISTLHQSSLGSLYLIMPDRLHPLWYTPLLPVLFFVSAVGVGLAMVIFESSLSSRAFHRGLELDLLGRVAKVIPFVLGLSLVLRFGILAVESKLGLLFTGDPLTLLFWLEVLVGGVVPIVLFALPAVRCSPRGLLAGALATIAGLMLNRFAVSWLAIAHPAGVSYAPNWMEIAVSFGIISAGVLVFAVVARFFPLFEEERHGAHVAPAQEPALAGRPAQSA